MFEIGERCEVHPGARIDVACGYLGDGAVVREGAVIEGHRVEIGREAFLNRGAWIGGGSSGDGSLVCGDFLHMGWNSHINTAREVRIGHEFGCGIETKVFSHGAYLSAWEGFPVQWEGVTIGDRVWMPNAWVNPGVTIGSDVVVAAGSVVARDLPSGCLAGGVPAKVLREDVYPARLDDRAARALLERIIADSGRGWEARVEERVVVVRDVTTFDPDRRTITGPWSAAAEAVRTQLRRNGIRFPYSLVGYHYLPWETR